MRLCLPGMTAKPRKLLMTMIGKLSKAQQLALFHSPLGVDAEKEGEEDSVVSEIYENERVIWNGFFKKNL